MNRSKRSERSIIADIAALLPRRTLQRRLARLVEEKRPILEGRSLSTAGIGEEPPLLSEDYVPISAESETIKRSVREPVQKRDPVGYNRAFLDAYRLNKTFYLSGEIRKRLDEKGRSRRAEKVFARLGMKPGDAFNIFLAQALVVVVPLTSQLRGLRGEVDIGKPRWLQALRSEYSRICQCRPTRAYPQTRQVERGTSSQPLRIRSERCWVSERLKLPVHVSANLRVCEEQYDASVPTSNWTFSPSRS